MRWKKGDKVKVFLQNGSFSSDTQISRKKVFYLAEGIVLGEVKEERILIDVKITKVFLAQGSFLSNFERGTSHLFSPIWVERGEEAYQICCNPSNRMWKCLNG